jgi:tocopherol O-methyltransferase
MRWMSETPGWLLTKIREYYARTTEDSYLASWSGSSLGLHFGIDGDGVATLDESLLNTNAYLADRARIGHGDRVLDAGCGVGGTAIWLSKNRDARVIGVSIAPNQVELAMQFARQHGVAGRVEFLCRDFMATGLPPRSFDVVYNIESLCHAFDLRAYLDHVAELLRDGGRFGCIDLFRGDRGDPLHAKAMCDGWILPSLGTMHDLGQELARAGFADVETIELTPRIMRSAATLQQKAQLRLTALRIEKLFLKREDPIYEGHTLAALGAVAGLASGAVTYGFVGGTRRLS